MFVFFYAQGRLPIGNKAIDDAFEIGVTQCLQQLQKTNPNLLLTASELRRAECDARYVPAVSLAIASILSKSTRIESQQYVGTIQDWKDRSRPIPSNLIAYSRSDQATCISYHGDGAESCFAMKRDDVQALGLIIERKLRSVLSCSSKSIVTSKENCKVDSDKDESDSKTFGAPPIEDIDLVPMKGNKKSKGSQLVHVENPDNETTENIEDGSYRDFDEWI